MDLEDYLLAAFASVIVIGVAFVWFALVYHGVKEDGLRRDCRAAGKMVIVDNGDEWHCAPVPAERAQ